jgi:hypothetical protein
MVCVMAENANVASIGALRDFAAALAVFQEQVEIALAAADMEVQRAHVWIDEQLRYWERARRDREDDASQAKLALQKKKIFKMWDKPPDCTEEEEALDVAEGRLEEAYDRVTNCKRWRIQYARAIEEYESPVRRLQGFVEADLERGKALLARMSDALDAYVEFAPAVGSSKALAEPEPSAPPVEKS